MGIMLLAVLMLPFFGMKLSLKGIRPDSMSIPQTTAVKGVFVLLVFLRHYKGYVTLERAIDQPFLTADVKMGQLIVALFLFYSGYGVMESFRNKGEAYLRAFPRKRILATLLHFDLAVLLYLLVQALAMGRFYDWKTMLLSLLAWNSVGNSNWFIWVILMLYLVSWAAGRLFSADISRLLAVTACSAVYVLLFWRLYPGIEWWYDTVFCYAAGMWYSFLRLRIERFLSGEVRFWVSFAGLFCLFRLFFWYRSNLAVYEMLSVALCLIAVMVSMKVRVGNRLLGWLGNQVFGVYIFQRLPMMLLERWGAAEWPYLFFGLSFVCTLLLSAGFGWCTKRIDRLLFKKA